MSKPNLFDELGFSDAPPKDPEPDRCKCSECGGVFNVSDCRTEHGHHDGWEMPAYTEIYCPNCEDDGCVDDFFFSGDEDE